MIIVVIAGLIITGYTAVTKDGSHPPVTLALLREIIGNARGEVAMLWAVFTGTLIAILLAVGQRILNLREAMDGWMDGAKSILTAPVILVLAWGIGNVCRDLGTATYIVGLLEGKLMPCLIPLASFIIGCITAFSTGTSYGTIAILMPVAVPLVYSLSGGDTGNLLFATIGAVITGSVFGDHCSPISDTTIMSSMACASDHIDHIKTQIPYALTVAAITGLTGFIPAALNVHPLISILLGMVMVFAVVRFAGKKVDGISIEEI